MVQPRGSPLQPLRLDHTGAAMVYMCICSLSGLPHRGSEARRTAELCHAGWGAVPGQDLYCMCLLGLHVRPLLPCRIPAGACLGLVMCMQPLDSASYEKG